MGQKLSIVQEYTPDTKPPQKENSNSLEKSKNENEGNVVNERESEKAKQKKLGVNVIKKDSDMPMKMESFIIDAIIIEKLKHSGYFKEIALIEIARALKRNLEDQYGGFWNVLIAKMYPSADSAFCLSKIQGTHIYLTYDCCYYTVFKGT